MTKNKKIVAMIPARIGSERLKKKNLALVDNKPLIFYSINAAIKSKIFDEIYINSDDLIFEDIAKRYKVNFYLRPKHLGSSEARSDDVIFDFLQSFNDVEILVWVNSISPLLNSFDISKCINFFKKKKLDSLILSNTYQVHSYFKDKPINFSKKGLFSKTQDLVPVKLLNYSIMMWKKMSFINSYKKKNKSALFCGKFYPFSLNKFLPIVKNKYDLNLCTDLIKSDLSRPVKYDRILKI
jgi:CMP-N-acetylneuraminic acid synthetase